MKSCVSQYRIFFSCRDGSVEVDAEVIYSADPNNHTALYSNNPTVNKNVLVAETLRKKILEGRFKNYDLKTVRIQGTGGGGCIRQLDSAIRRIVVLTSFLNLNWPLK